MEINCLIFAPAFEREGKRREKLKRDTGQIGFGKPRKKKFQKNLIKIWRLKNKLYLCTRFQRWRHEGLNRGEKKDEKEFFKILK